MRLHHHASQQFKPGDEIWNPKVALVGPATLCECRPDACSHLTDGQTCPFGRTAQNPSHIDDFNKLARRMFTRALLLQCPANFLLKHMAGHQMRDLCSQGLDNMTAERGWRLNFANEQGRTSSCQYVFTTACTTVVVPDVSDGRHVASLAQTRVVPVPSEQGRVLTCQSYACCVHLHTSR